jgi:hypothetical protein
MMKNPREFRIVAMVTINVMFLVVSYPYLRQKIETNAPDLAGQLLITLIVIGASLWAIWIDMNAIYDEHIKEKNKNDEGND